MSIVLVIVALALFSDGFCRSELANQKESEQTTVMHSGFLCPISELVCFLKAKSKQQTNNTEVDILLHGDSSSVNLGITCRQRCSVKLEEIASLLSSSVCKSQEACSISFI